jgi:hypothetical protein
MMMTIDPIIGSGILDQFKKLYSKRFIQRITFIFVRLM